MILGVATVVTLLALRPRSSVSGAAALLVGGGASLLAGGHGAAAAILTTQVLPLVLFLTAAIWLAELARRAGLTDRIARGIDGAPAARTGWGVLAIACSMTAALTATVSLDGAVVVMAPVLVALTRGDQELLRPLVLACVGVANAFSLATPQGNPTNLLVIDSLDLSLSSYSLSLAAPAALASVVCAAAVAVAFRHRLAARRPSPGPAETAGWSAAEAIAAGGLACAGAGAVAGPALGIAPVWTTCVAALLAGVATLGMGLRTARPQVTWRVAAQVGGLALLLEAIAGRVELPAALPGRSLMALLVLAGAAAALAAIVGNLPASVTLAGLLGHAPLPAFAVLAGLSVGALATPHGSVATLIAYERVGAEGRPARASHLLLCAAAAVVATVAAVALLWLGG